MIKPYYQDDYCTIYNGDCREIMPQLEPVDLVLTDPPYGISYATSWNLKKQRNRSIVNDQDTSIRDAVIAALDVPMVIFGSWKALRPRNVDFMLIWEKTGSSGMGNLDLPWRPNTEEIYLLGKWIKRTAPRQSAVIRFDALCGEQLHPNEKPIPLLRYLIQHSPAGAILDPFMGSGTTLRAAKDLQRHAIGIELEEKYCEIAAKRLAQEVLPLDFSA